MPESHNDLILCFTLEIGPQILEDLILKVLSVSLLTLYQHNIPRSKHACFYQERFSSYAELFSLVITIFKII